ncbi:hypothetical protein M5689_022143 [Euphorbia peplus]|nr:hypothetical protein M5689_022143 [Euphorbia peplus]
MSTCVGPSPCRPALPTRISSKSRSQARVPCVLPVGLDKILTRSLKVAAFAPKYAQSRPALQQRLSRKCLKHALVCLLGGKGKSEGGKEVRDIFSKSSYCLHYEVCLLCFVLFMIRFRITAH